MLTNYLRVALRNLLRQKAYTTINILGLAVGMACCILLLIRYELSFDKHHTKADRIYKVLWRKRAVDGEFYNSRFTMGPLAKRLKADFPEIEDATSSFNRRMWVRTGDRGFDQWVCMAEASYTDIFDVPLVRGNPEGLLTPNTVFLTEESATILFGDVNPLGKTVSIDYKWLQDDFTVAGVMENHPETSTYGLRFDVLTATSSEMTQLWEGWNPYTSLYPFRTYLLLSEDASPEALQQKLPAFVQRHMEDTQEDAYLLQAMTRVHLYSATEYDAPHATYGDIRTVYAFALVGLFILLIACVNFMNLATARSAGRAREVGLRKVVGARQTQLIGQHMGEALLVSFIALGLAIAFVKGALPAWSTFLQKTMVLELGNDVGLLGLLVGIAVLVGLVAGSYPALVLASFLPTTVLKGETDPGIGWAWLRKVLVVFQFSIGNADHRHAGVLLTDGVYPDGRSRIQEGPDRGHAHLRSQPIAEGAPRSGQAGLLETSQRAGSNRIPLPAGVRRRSRSPGDPHRR